MKTSEVLLNFFKNIPHNYTRVAEWYTPAMEVQINVSACGGELIRPGVYADDNLQWYHVRIPKNAKSDPIDNDFELTYPLDLYVDSIGMTGWDWKHQKSIRFGFDYDAITGHAPGVGITEEELAEIKQRAFEIPELLILRSTSGTGLHLYLECDVQKLPSTVTHTEHSALAMSALQDLSNKVGFDFHSHDILDVGGGNMWVWARKMTPENKGLTLLKDNIHPDGSRAYYTPPENWRDFLDVARGKRTKARLRGVSDEDQDIIDKHTETQVKVTLDEEHKRLINDLHELCPQTTTQWLPDQQLLQTHTAALKHVFNTKKYKGFFDTLSVGRDPTKPNCFGYPNLNGGWRFLRFGKGTNEAPSWSTSPEGWTYCYFNETLSLERTSQFFNGVEDDKGGFVFTTVEDALAAAESLGTNIQIPEVLQDREITFRTHKDGRLLVEIIKRPKLDDALQIQGWLKKKSVWYKLFDTDSDMKASGVDIQTLDTYIRSLVTLQHEPEGWSVKHRDGYWIKTKKDDAKTLLSATPLASDINLALATALQNSWTVVNLPFQEEYPVGRRWNLLGAQFKYKPADLEPDVQPSHPHWDMVLEHCGKGLNPYLKDMPWAKDNNILTGRDYLLAWVTCMFRDPFQQLPYLFFSGPESCGKSTLHEALSCLMSKGVVKADTALTSKDGFNGELASGILCVVEEKNISYHPEAHARLKEWVSALELSVHAKFKQVYTQLNSTHWMHMANYIENIPIFTGDTRVISIPVQPYENTDIPKHEMMEFLKAEAPHFMVTLQRFVLPDPIGRLFLPIIETDTKSLQQDANKNPFEEFLEEQCYYIPGERISFKDFYDRFCMGLSEVEKSIWTKRKVISSLRHNQPFGKGSKNTRYIGNISFEPPGFDTPTHQYVRQDDALVLVELE